MVNTRIAIFRQSNGVIIWLPVKDGGVLSPSEIKELANRARGEFIEVISGNSFMTPVAIANYRIKNHFYDPENPYYKKLKAKA